MSRAKVLTAQCNTSLTNEKCTLCPLFLKIWCFKSLVFPSYVYATVRMQCHKTQRSLISMHSNVLFYFFDVWHFPRFIVIRFKRPVKSEVNKESFFWIGFYPIVFIAMRCRWTHIYFYATIFLYL